MPNVWNIIDAVKNLVAVFLKQKLPFCIEHFQRMIGIA